MSTDIKTLNVITVDASPANIGFEGHFVLPLTYDTNVTNELTNRMKAVQRYDELVFTDLSNTRHKAKDLLLTGSRMENHFSYEKDGTFATGANIFYFRCNDFS